MKQQRGNILFLILLAVVLFAALAYAVTQSMRGGGQDATKEQGQSYAAELIQYGAMLQNTINRLMLVNDCKDTQLSFENTLVTSYVNSSAPAKCKIFDPAGGGMSFKAIPARYLDTSYSAAYDYGYGGVFDQQSITYVGLSDANGTGVGKDLVMFIPYVTANLCLEFNKMLGKTTIPDMSAVRLADLGDSRHFKGTFFSTGGYQFNAAIEPNAGCVKAGFGTTMYPNVIYLLLLAR